MLQNGNQSDGNSRAAVSGRESWGRMTGSGKDHRTVFPARITIESCIRRVGSTRFFHGGGQG